MSETLDEMHERQEAAIKDAGVPTEADMRSTEALHPTTADELAAYVKGLVDRPHDYGTCVYAMSMAAVAAFNFVAGTLGCTGFQASCADMDILRRTRRMEHGFTIINANDLLYPQYNVPGRVKEWIEKTLPSLAPVAAELLRNQDGAHPDVIAHWKNLATMATEEAK